MKTKNPNQQVKIKNTPDIKSVKNLSQVIPFYITIVSLTAIFALLTIFLLEKNETLKCVKSGLVQKIDNGKVIWTKP